MKHFSLKACLLAAVWVLSGCASTANPKDPFESFNRAMFTFNDKVDEVALKPAAETYSDYLPSFVQTGISNFFGNLGDVWTALNNFLQGKMADGMNDVMRVAVNSTLGFGGLLDIGSEANLPKHKEDFGQTLGVWGVTPGPYVVLPLLGPSTLRDTVARPVDGAGDIWMYTNPIPTRNIGLGVRIVDQRANLLGASNLLEDAALDRYLFVRDAYLQRRESNVRDGEAPPISYEDDVGPTSESSASAANPVQGAEPVAQTSKAEEVK